MVEKRIVVNLIKGHLINMHLINGLNALGICADDYHLNLGDIIFKLMNLKDEDEELFEVYLDWCAEISRGEIFKDDIVLEKYANDIYEFLAIK